MITFCRFPTNRLSFVEGVRDTTVDGPFRSGREGPPSDKIRHSLPSRFEMDKQDIVKGKPQQISSLLNPNERASLLNYLGPNVLCVASGVVQLLFENGGTWRDAKVGVVCFCRDYILKQVSLRLIDPIEGERARELWRIEIPKWFLSAKSHSHLITFDNPTTSQTVGLNFSDEREATRFQEAVELQKQMREKTVKNEGEITPVRTAPMPPTMSSLPILQNSSHDGTEATNNNIPFDTSFNEISLKLENNSVTTDGVCVPMARKAKKKTLFGTIRNKFGKKKKENTTLDIGNPTNFQHIKHVGIESLNDTDRQTVLDLADQMKVDKSNEKEMKVLIKNVVKDGDRIRASIKRPKAKVSAVEALPTIAEVKTTDSVDPLKDDVWGDKEELPFNRSPPPSLANPLRSPGSVTLMDARNSIRLYPTTGRRGTPNTVKQMDQMRMASTSGARPKLEELTRPMTSTNQQPPGDEHAPPLPSRSSSFNWRNGPLTSTPKVKGADHILPTPPESPIPPPAAPPSRRESLMRQIRGMDRNRPDAPVIVPPKDVPVDRNILPISGAPSAPPPPPPPLPAMAPPSTPPSSRTSALPSPSSERANLMDAIRNATKTTLRPVSVHEIVKSPTTPTFDGGIIDSIQKQLDARRQAVASDSDSEEDTCTDSDWDDE